MYLTSELHQHLKIQAAVEGKSMSEMAKRAISFFLSHADVVYETEASRVGQTHRVYSCPDCKHSVVFKEGELAPLGEQPGVMVEEGAELSDASKSQDEELVPC
ncbi:hypothetical protein [Leptolyngbya sp. FACHB-261]|uniref:hypothetical protein n=1 Tax=Leptolyngbya sp. FACHB-261 TaxID=2692806 RepID=UPI001F54A99A|nr:hypothetical protein [Leptolyngbya sp. FACHB-261]